MQILLMFAAILLTGILVALVICSISNESLADALCACCKPQPQRRRRITIGPDGEVCLSFSSLLAF